MIKVSDIVGALVRSVTVARIQADFMSGQASIEYLKDPTLRSFPVPRTEIQKVDMDLRLVIADAQQVAANPIAIAKKSLLDRVPSFVDRLLTLNYETGNQAKLKSLFGANALAAAAIVTKAVRDRIAQNPLEFTSKWLVRQKSAAAKLKGAAEQGVYSAMATFGVSGTLDGAFPQESLQEALSFCEATPQALKIASDIAAITGFDLDLSVKKDDLVNVPEHLVSGISLTLSVDNYEWTTATDAQGNAVNKLTVK
jgi:hypothetical protein